MNSELSQSLAYGTEEWWEYLRGNIDAVSLVDRLTTLGLETEETVIASARVRNMPLPVYVGGAIYFLPQPY